MVAVADLMSEVVSGLRAGGGPVLVEAETYRWHGHYEGDPQRYREPAELAEWQARDPLVVARNRLAAAGVAESEVDVVDDEVERELAAGVEAARTAPYPAAETVGWYVSAPVEPVAEPALATGETIKTMTAIQRALDHELRTDPTVFLAGVDVGAGGNVFGLTRGLAERYPSRVRDTPISESAIVGAAVGAAMAGLRPVVELMCLDFLGVCLDQLLNQAAKLRFMTGGRAPVVFIENRLQYGMKGPAPAADHLVPIGRAIVRREGTDVTVVSWSRMVQEALRSAETLAADGISVEVVDLRTITPLDRDTVLASLAKTNRLVIAHEAVRDFGPGAELAALAVDEGFWHLDAPVLRVAARYQPAPYSPALEKVWLPDADDITATVRRSVARFLPFLTCAGG